MVARVAFLSPGGKKTTMATSHTRPSTIRTARTTGCRSSGLPALFSRTERGIFCRVNPSCPPPPISMSHTAITARLSIVGAITMTAAEDSMPSNCRIIWVYPYVGGVITGRPATNTRVASGSPSAELSCRHRPYHPVPCFSDHNRAVAAMNMPGSMRGNDHATMGGGFTWPEESPERPVLEPGFRYGSKECHC